MSVIVDKNTKKLFAKVSPANTRFPYSEQAIKYGTQLVGGVTPKKGGSKHLGLQYSTQ